MVYTSYEMIHAQLYKGKENDMTRKIHHLVAATDNRTLTRLTNIYATTFEEAWCKAEQWQQEYCPELPSLSVTVQPQGFRTCFTCLPGFIDEEEEA